MTSQSDEQYVRERWERVTVLNGDGIMCDGLGAFSSWERAAAFARQREEEIRQIESELELLREFERALEVNSSHRPIVLQRILTREQAALAELRKEMR